jgi:hypothetical protein
MSYNKLPLKTILASNKFIIEMNHAIRTFTFYRSGMVVCADQNGYWLEIDGVKDSENLDILSAARKIVLGD